jgi:glycine cleavage system H protein
VGELYYTTQNEWISLNGNKAAVGLSGSAILGDVVYIELPAVGLRVEKGEPCATVESTKAVNDVHAPVSGVISAINDHVYDEPDSVSEEHTWLFTVEFEGSADTSEWKTEKKD